MSAFILLICLGGVGVGMAYNQRILIGVSALAGIILASNLIIKLFPILVIIAAAVWYFEKKQAGLDPFENFRRTNQRAA